MKKIRAAVVCFFDAYPPQSGAGSVINDFFISLKINKKLFQYSFLKKKK